MLFNIIPYFTYFLALQKCTPNSNYTIHGLWIDYYRGGYPQNCNLSNKFYLNQLEPIKKDLNSYWYSCSDNSESFWKHEWLKHGTCFYPKLNVFNYFNKTLNLFFINQIKIKDCKYKNCLIPIDFTDL